MNFIHRLRATNVRRRERAAAAAGAKPPRARLSGRALRSSSSKGKRKKGAN